ncbi:MAG: hypothetical protein U9Q15_02495 [Patescibacteria group bacterium]|nr:hypothetical protein [Patescibacteria group bacterium]
MFLTGKYWKTKEGLTIKLYKRDTIEVLSKSVADIRPEPIVDPEQVTLSETDLFKDFSLTQSIEEKTAWSFQLGNIEVSRPDGVIVEK